MRITTITAGLLALATSAACGKGANYLEGSISESHDLTFGRVEVRSLSDQAAWEIGYFNDLEGGGADTVAKVVFDEPSGGVKADKKIDVVKNAGVVQRVTAANDNFPDVEAAHVTFFVAPKIGETARGEFDATFINGKTLDGGFEAEVVECTFADDKPCD